MTARGFGVGGQSGSATSPGGGQPVPPCRIKKQHSAALSMGPMQPAADGRADGSMVIYSAALPSWRALTACRETWRDAGAGRSEAEFTPSHVRKIEISGRVESGKRNNLRRRCRSGEYSSPRCLEIPSPPGTPTRVKGCETNPSLQGQIGANSSVVRILASHLLLDQRVTRVRISVGASEHFFLQFLPPQNWKQKMESSWKRFISGVGGRG